MLFGISPPHIAQVPSECLLHAARFTLRLLPSLRGRTAEQSRRQLRRDTVDRSEGIDLILFIPSSYRGSMSLEPQRTHQSRDQREARFVLAQQDKLVCSGLFFSA